MKVVVKFFARCREIAGVPQQVVELEEGKRIQDLNDLLLTAYPALKEVRVVLSLNHAYAKPETELRDRDEVAIFPPVSGG